ncbi:hypothetical protein [Roseovarius sp. ZX-A-9]|uniref:hypothetical protein n=1 Tax=Roseovarius sp. ZX-A-9 TaxID=3014783 RepID=UPI00232B0493|nr:hypothetical protein [Roseovarius sp. ZX-A-9]
MSKADTAPADLGDDSVKVDAESSSEDRVADSPTDAVAQRTSEAGAKAEAADRLASEADAKSGDEPDAGGADTESDAPESQDAIISDTAPEDAVKEDETPENDEPSADTTGSEPLDESAAPALVPVAPESRPAFWPMVWGGIVAAGIGAALAYVILPQLGVLSVPDTAFRDDVMRLQTAQAEKIAAQADEIETLRSTVAQVREDAASSGAGDAPDLSELQKVQSDLQAKTSALSDEIASIRSQIAALESRPAADGSTVSQGEIATLKQMLMAQSDTLAAQQAEIAALSADAAAQEAAAQASATATLRRAALTRIRSALDTGASFTMALDDLEATGQDIPEELRAVAAEGAPSLAALQEAFPPAARIALANARKELGESGAAPTGVMAFLSDQLGARSLEPREGDDPDAVLSRVEFALREARLGDALAEIETLPPSGQAALADWADSARMRMNATRAVDALGAELN